VLKLTLENCNNRDEGDREVVTTIFGSYVPTFAYSSSTCDLGSAVQLNPRLPSPDASSSACRLHGPSPTPPTRRTTPPHSSPAFHHHSPTRQLTRLRLIQHQILCPLTRLLAQLGRQRLALRQQVLYPLLALIDCALLRLLRFLVDVLAPLAGLAPELGVSGGRGGKTQRVANLPFLHWVNSSRSGENARNRYSGAGGFELRRRQGGLRGVGEAVYGSELAGDEESAVQRC
jgi:hypothetical protein